MTRSAQPPALCDCCGKALFQVIGDGLPTDGSYSLCNGCGSIYVHQGGWRLAKEPEISVMSSEMFCRAILLAAAIRNRRG